MDYHKFPTVYIQYCPRNFFMFKKMTLQKMNKWKHITPVFCLFLCVKAQETSTNQHDFNPLHPNMAVVLVVLSILFFLTFMMVIFAKVCHTDNPPTRLQNFGEFVRTRSRFSGIDRAVVESLPFFQFSSLKGSKEGLECAVCLLMFEDTETLRVLPKCQHAFHMNCIDKWLENHSSCPLCRYKFDIKDLNSLTYTNSFSYPRISIDEPNLQFFIQREETNDKSSRFSVSSNTIQNLASVRKDKPLIQKFEKESILHSLKHKIFVSDVLNKSRWSDVNSSDMLSLSSEMLDDISGKRFSYMGSDSGMFTTELSAKEQISKIKEDLERKRLYEYKVGKSENSCSSDGNKQLDLSISTEFRSFVTDDKRSMSEITNVPRFAEYNSRSRISTLTTPTSVEMDDDKNRLWLTIAKKTILLFGGGGTRSDDPKGVEDV